MVTTKLEMHMINILDVGIQYSLTARYGATDREERFGPLGSATGSFRLLIRAVGCETVTCARCDQREAGMGSLRQEGGAPSNFEDEGPFWLGAGR